MTSTNLKRKSNFSAAFKRIFKRRFARVITLVVISILTGAAASAMELSDYFKNSTYYSGENDNTFSALALIGISAIIAGLFSLITSGKLFEETYNKRACDFYFAVPIKREEYYFANYLFGIIMNTLTMIIPITIYAITMTAVSNSRVQFTFDGEYLLQIGITVLLAVYAIFSAFILCAVISGKKVHYAVLSIICLLCPSIAVEGIIERLNTIWGLYVSSTAIAISPASNAISAAMFGSDTNFVLYASVSAVETVCMFAAGMLVFKRRKAEVAEVSITGKAVPYIILAVFVLSGFMYTSIVANTVTTVIYGIVFSAVAGLFFSLIFFKKAFTKESAITTLSVCLAGVIFVCSIYLPGYKNYVKYLPDASEIESIELNSLNNDTIDSLLSGIISYSYAYDEYSDNIKITSEQGIKNLLALHSKLIDDATISRSEKYYQDITEIFSDDYDFYETLDCRIKYNLKNGSTVVRSYSAIAPCVYDELLQLFRDEEIIRQIEPYNLNNVLFAASTSYYDYDDYDEYYYDEDEYYYDDYDDDDLYDDTVKLISADKCSELMDIYIAEMLTLSNSELADILCSGYSDLCTPFYSYAYSQDSDNTFNIPSELGIFYMSEDIPESFKQELMSMKPEEIYKGYYSEYDDSSPFLYVNTIYLSVYESQIKVLDYIENA